MTYNKWSPESVIERYSQGILPEKIVPDTAFVLRSAELTISDYAFCYVAVKRDPEKWVKCDDWEITRNRATIFMM